MVNWVRVWVRILSTEFGPDFIYSFVSGPDFSMHVRVQIRILPTLRKNSHFIRTAFTFCTEFQYGFHNITSMLE